MELLLWDLAQRVWGQKDLEGSLSSPAHPSKPPLLGGTVLFLLLGGILVSWYSRSFSSTIGVLLLEVIFVLF